MKHWSALTELESEIIRVGEFKNLFKLLVAGSENYVDIKVLQSAIYTMETMIDDIDSKLYEKFETVFDAIRDEGDDVEVEFEEFDNMNARKFEYPSTTSYAYDPATSEEDEAFKDLEKAIKNWHKATP
jgi:hypothetical protein